MQRLIPYLTLPLTIFVFIAVILINVGGVNPDSNSSLVREKNSAFDLLTWKYTITPLQSYQSYSYHLYLNRLCAFSESRAIDATRARNGIVGGYCRNSRGNGKLEDGRDIYASDALVGAISPFNFDTVNLSIPFAFYILTAICAFVLLFWPVMGGKRFPRVVGLAGALFSGLAFLFILVASAVVTRQMSHLKDQIIHKTRKSSTIPSTGYQDDTTEFRTTVQDVSIGSVVQGLTWAAVVVMAIECIMWTWAAMTVKKDRSTMTTKHEQYVQG